MKYSSGSSDTLERVRTPWKEKTEGSGGKRSRVGWKESTWGKNKGRKREAA
jgi:hypothetical protein